MKSSDILMSLTNEDLRVWKVHGQVCVNYHYAYISDGVVLIGAIGRGADFEAACDDYLKQIRGKKLVFEEPGYKRRVVTVLG